MLEHGFGLYVAITLVLIVLLIISNAIPFYGFMHKRWKGCFLGCLIQPIFIVVASFLALGIIEIHQKSAITKLQKAAMVTLRTKGTDGNAKHTFLWYLKADEECFCEPEETSDFVLKESERYEVSKLFDIVPLDSFRVCVDDRIIVKFDLENRKVTASEDDDSIEVVRVDWDKVNSYFSKSSH